MTTSFPPPDFSLLEVPSAFNE